MPEIEIWGLVGRLSDHWSSSAVGEVVRFSPVEYRRCKALAASLAITINLLPRSVIPPASAAPRMWFGNFILIKLLNAQLAAQKLPFSWDPHLFGCYITWLYCCPLKTAIRFGFCDDINATTVYYGALVAKREAFRSSNYILMSCEKIFVPLSGGDRVKIVLKIFGYSFYREYIGGMMDSIKGDFILNSKRSFCYDFFIIFYILLCFLKTWRNYYP